jgi:cytochrome P450
VYIPPTLQIDRSLLRSLATFNRDRLRWLDEAAALGPVVVMKFGPVRAWIVSSGDLARHILVSDAGNWRRPPSATNPIRLGFGENLFTQTDRDWALVQPQLSNAFRRKTLATKLAALPEVIGQQSAAIRPGDRIDFGALTNRIAMSVAASVLFDVRLEDRILDELTAAQKEVVKWVGNRIGSVRSTIPFAVGRRAGVMRGHAAVLHEWAGDLIDAARDDPPDPDTLLAALLRTRVNGAPLSPMALRKHVVGLLFAGNETTAAALAWALVNGSRHPDSWAMLRTDPSAAANFVSETLRLTPAVWSLARSTVGRSALLPVGNERFLVRRHEVVTIYLRGIYREPTAWPNPTRFDPARHDALSADQQRTLLPFGLGPRGCIGQHLALAELQTALPVLARCGNVTLETQPVEDPLFALQFREGLRGRFVMPTQT